MLIIEENGCVCVCMGRGIGCNRARRRNKWELSVLSIQFFSKPENALKK